MNTVRTSFPEGSGFFETLLTVDGKIAELNRHMRRAITTSETLNIAMPSEDEIRDLLKTTLKEDPHEVGRLRICFTVNGVTATHQQYERKTSDARITFSTLTSVAVGEQYKTFPYDAHFEIVDEALIHGFDDALQFNKENYATETGVSNIAFLIGGQWITPPISAGILPGVMRAIAIERCGVNVGNVHISQIPDVEGAILLSSLKMAQGISHIGEYRLPDMAPVAALTRDIASKVEYFSIG